MHFTDFPKLIGMDVYERTRSRLTEAYAKTPHVMDLLEFGTIPFPGISDMDFHVIVKAHAATSFPRLQQFEDDERFAMLHKQFVLTEESLKELHYVDPWLVKGASLIRGESIPKRMLREEEHHELSLYYILLNWLLPFLRTIAQIHCTQELPVREMLEIIKGTAYPYREFNRMGVLQNASDPSAPFFETLRSTWFTLARKDQEERILDAFHRFSHSIGTLLIITEKAMRDRMQQVETPRHSKNSFQRKLLKKFSHSVIIDGGDDIFIYQEGRTTIELLYERFRSPLSPFKPERGIYVLPLALCAIQNAHVFCEGPVSHHYKQCFASDLPTIPLYNPHSVIHLIDVMNKNVKETTKIHGGKQPFTTFGMPSPLPSRSLRSFLGKSYDTVLAFLTRTPLALFLRSKKFHMILPS